jgi:hypothetical protein
MTPACSHIAKNRDCEVADITTSDGIDTPASSHARKTATCEPAALVVRGHAIVPTAGHDGYPGPFAIAIRALLLTIRDLTTGGRVQGRRVVAAVCDYAAFTPRGVSPG